MLFRSTSITSHIHNWALFVLWLSVFILSRVISPLFSSSILGTYLPGEFIFQLLEKVSFHSNPKKGNAKECSNYHTRLKILQARLQQYMNRELPDVRAGFRKGRGTRDQIANIGKIIKKAREFQKSIYFFFIKAKAFDCVDHNKLQKILKEMGFILIFGKSNTVMYSLKIK